MGQIDFPIVSIGTTVVSRDQVPELLKRAEALCENGSFCAAVAIYQKLVDSGLVNPYNVKLMMLEPLCKATEFEKAAALAEEFLTILRQGGAPVNSSRAMYWRLLAKHKGDKHKAMDEFVQM